MNAFFKTELLGRVVYVFREQIEVVAREGKINKKGIEKSTKPWFSVLYIWGVQDIFFCVLAYMGG